MIVAKPCSASLAYLKMESYTMTKVRVWLSIIIDDDDATQTPFGSVALYFDHRSIEFTPSKNVKIISISSETYPNLKVVTQPPSNKVGELEDERSDPNKTDIH